MIKSIRVFDEQEWGSVRECLELIGQARPAEARSARAGLQVLLHLAQAISFCPPLLREQKLGGSQRSAATLVRLLRRRAGSNDVLNLPTKAVLGHSFQVAKVNFLLLLRQLGKSLRDSRFHEQVFLDLVLLNVLTLMSEELFFAILQDEQTDERVRGRAAARLMDLWEHRLSWQAREFAPIIYSLWNLRGELPPVYGTLTGVSELLRLSQRLHPAWGQFLQQCGEEAAEALEEFLFDLSHEEILRVRQAMAERGLHAVDGDNLQDLGLERRREAEEAADPRRVDPRVFYRFFRRRRKNAALRRRGGLPGPHKTIEEMLLCHLLSGEQEPAGLPGREGVGGLA